MQPDMQDFEIQVDEIPVSKDVANRLDDFCAALTEMKASGQSPNPDPIKGGLAALTVLLQRENEAGFTTDWIAKFTKSPFGNGEIIALENKSCRQHLTVSVDRNGAFYNGTWAHFVSDTNVEGAMFELKESPEGYVFEVSDGAVTKTCILDPNLGGLAWAAASAVEGVLPDWLAGSKVKSSEAAQQPPASQPKLSNEPVTNNLTPTVQNDVSRSAEGQTNLCPACAGQVRNTAKFCPTCGAKLSIVNNVSAEVQSPKHSDEPPQSKKLCRKCGRPLGPGARFCNGCGTSV